MARGHSRQAPWPLTGHLCRGHGTLVQTPWPVNARSKPARTTIHGRSYHDPRPLGPRSPAARTTIPGRSAHDPWPLGQRSMAARATIHGRSCHDPWPHGQRSMAARTTIPGRSDHDPWALVPWSGGASMSSAAADRCAARSWTLPLRRSIPRDPARLAVARGRPVDGEAWHMVREPRRRVVGT